ncbi:MAG: hypothetical protein JHD07_01930 [Bradyrhizobium sp.]|uniref:hypothetical protein n=1 Tax=Bradyrhizobium sp. TaxID=376 RepID=UPI001A195A83|nr:hypothetical protein [Bradyrhizobium sp.]MBJ7402114.1 hypothetical protein [Bradyrhizobium sp.]
MYLILNSRKTRLAFILITALSSGNVNAQGPASQRGEYLATIGACAACHTPPAVKELSQACTPEEQARETTVRSNPDWFAHLDPAKTMAGGVPFILRFSATSSGLVQSSNITPDMTTGIGNWSEAQIIDAIKLGIRPDGSSLFRFAPHTFYENLAQDDLQSLAAYLKSLRPISNAIQPRNLPFPTQPANPKPSIPQAPQGRNPARAEYLMNALVGCKECHSYHDTSGTLQPFIGGDPIDPFVGVFRLGPDLPLRQNEKGWSAFPYPGYAVLYGGNLTRFGQGGDLEPVTPPQIARAIREGVGTVLDQYGRPQPLAHVMLWQFYRDMTDTDALALSDYLKSLNFIPHDIGQRLRLFGTDREAAFKQVFGTLPSSNDRLIFGLDGMPSQCPKN